MRGWQDAEDSGEPDTVCFTPVFVKEIPLGLVDYEFVLDGVQLDETGVGAFALAGFENRGAGERTAHERDQFDLRLLKFLYELDGLDCS